MTARIWVPAGLSRRKELATLAYVVIDELESSLVGLTVSPWPTLDDRGRLHFDLERAREVGARKRALQRYLAKHRSPRRSPADRFGWAIPSRAGSRSRSKTGNSSSPRTGWFHRSRISPARRGRRPSSPSSPPRHPLPIDTPIQRWSPWRRSPRRSDRRGSLRNPIRSSGARDDGPRHRGRPRRSFSPPAASSTMSTISISCTSC